MKWEYKTYTWKSAYVQWTSHNEVSFNIIKRESRRGTIKYEQGDD